MGWHHGIGIGLSHYQSTPSIQYTSNIDDSNSTSNVTSNSTSNNTSIQRLKNDFSTQDSKALFSTLVGINGYSISPNWSILYAVEQYRLNADIPSTDNTSELKNTLAEISLGYSVYQFNKGLNIYPLIGLRHISHQLSIPNEYQNTHNQTQFYAGATLDLPINRNWALHFKIDTSLHSDLTLSNVSAMLNYRINRHWSVLAKAQVSHFQLTQGERQTAQFYDIDNSIQQIGLKLFYIW